MSPSSAPSASVMAEYHKFMANVGLVFASGDTDLIFANIDVELLIREDPEFARIFETFPDNLKRCIQRSEERRTGWAAAEVEELANPAKLANR